MEVQMRASWVLLLALSVPACIDDGIPDLGDGLDRRLPPGRHKIDAAPAPDASGGGADAAVPAPDGGVVVAPPDATASPDAAAPPPPDPLDPTFQVRLVPQGVTGVQRVNLAIPLPPALLADASRIRIAAGGTELAAARVALASWPDGSLRAVQVQVDVNVAAAVLDVEVGATPAAGNLAAVAVSTTLAANGTPRVWAVLPAAWLAPSLVAGPLLPRAAIAGTALDAWGGVCDYARWGTAAFRRSAATRARGSSIGRPRSTAATPPPAIQPVAMPSSTIITMRPLGSRGECTGV